MSKRIFNQEKTEEITEPDLSMGYLVDDTRFVAHHEAQEAVEELYHYDEKSLGTGIIVRTRVVEREGVPAHGAYDEYEDIYVYVPYTASELIERQQNDFRARRAVECFPIVNRGVLWYEKLTEVQKSELSAWYEAWLNAPQTLSAPEIPAWIKTE